LVKTFWILQSFQFYGYFQLVYILSFQKIYICLKKIFGTSKLFKKIWSQIPLFQQISTLEPNFPMKFLKFHILILVMYFITNNLSKTVYCIKIGQQMAEISWKGGWKTLYFSQKANKKPLENHDFFQVSHIFQHSLGDISDICWPILMQSTVLERLLVVDYMFEIWIWDFKNFIGKLGSKAEICW
jgi:hypothetical protein